jgi:phage shock protein PspC (stress-responsive transcriptional regulator)
MKRFYRIKKDAVLGGVCTGLAKYTDIDVMIIRIITVILLLGTGFFPVGLVYILVVLLVPYASDRDQGVVSEQ